MTLRKTISDFDQALLMFIDVINLIDLPLHFFPSFVVKSVQICAVGCQGCGLGLYVSVSKRSRDVPTSRLDLVSRKIVNVSVSSRSREADVSVSSFYVSCPCLLVLLWCQLCINSFLMGM